MLLVVQEIGAWITHDKTYLKVKRTNCGKPRMRFYRRRSTRAWINRCSESFRWLSLEQCTNHFAQQLWKSWR